MNARVGGCLFVRALICHVSVHVLSMLLCSCVMFQNVPSDEMADVAAGWQSFHNALNKEHVSAQHALAWHAWSFVVYVVRCVTCHVSRVCLLDHALVYIYVFVFMYPRSSALYQLPHVRTRLQDTLLPRLHIQRDAFITMDSTIASYETVLKRYEHYREKMEKLQQVHDKKRQ